MSIVPESVEFHVPGVPPAVLMIFITWAILFSLSLFVRARLAPVPRGINVFFELIFDFIFTFADTAIGKEAHKYYPLFIGIFLFVLTGNFLGLVPGFISPTANVSVTLGLALITFVYYHAQGFREHGLKYLLQFLGPRLPWYLFPINMLMLVIELVSHTARVISLSLRLFINIFAKEVLLGILASLLVGFFLGPTLIDKGLSLTILFLRPLIILLGVLVSFVQAFIFAALAIVYVAGAVTESH
ncbi:MAG: ATP synthase F0 subunit A [Elusimicrobia bacterium RIFOXYA2_FULL_50_26]|nr:MAG: ATP synthase F0 subunit A [Elusimicrobia bacterium RIFOXYA2_FULL_50_26]OGS23416.1 MAG: ATP synthase F0 subunit A [Elusimicrobia bacterium RIFOXYB2_FULL_50_12]